MMHAEKLLALASPVMESCYCNDFRTPFRLYDCLYPAMSHSVNDLENELSENGVEELRKMMTIHKKAIVSHREERLRHEAEARVLNDRI